jgi:phosphatidylserine decarboxylase
MRQYEAAFYKSYNDFFTRKIKKGMRPLPEDPEILFSPCDGKVSVYPIGKDTSFVVKDTRYTTDTLIRNRKIARHFIGGYAIVLRLTVDDYHRYCYIDDGMKSDNYFIPGVYHTVNPVANDYAKIYKENAREFTMMKTKHFGDVLQMEVGALMVGRICNHHGAGQMKRGIEKGYFEFGGSTIVLFVQGNKVEIREELLERTVDLCETKIRQGEALGKSIQSLE